MSYKNRPLTAIVNKLYLTFEYYDVNANYVYYSNLIDIVIENLGELNSDSNLTLIFKFTVPLDFPNRNQIETVSKIDVVLYHTDEGTPWPPFLRIKSNSEEIIFGKKLEAGQEAKIVITIPMLKFYCYT
jgi:hypothetical protein